MHCQQNNIKDEIIIVTNISTLPYIKNARTWVLPKMFRWQNATPKSKLEKNRKKLDKITGFPQFEREVQNRNNGKYFVLKERTLSVLNAMKESKETNETLSY